jgi:hypothetical protein
MKTKVNNLIFKVLSILFSAMLIISCDEDGDTTPPVIQLHAPAEGAVLKIGSDIHFDMDISDNEALRSYKVEIHDNIQNPHNHTRAVSGEEADREYFKFQKTWNDMEGLKSKKVHHHEIIIPENAIPGEYHLIVYCLDISGNESNVVRHIELSPDGEEEHHTH